MSTVMTTRRHYFYVKMPIADLVSRGVHDYDVTALTLIVNYLAELCCEVREIGWKNGAFQYEIDVPPAVAPTIGGAMVFVDVEPTDRDGRPSGIGIVVSFNKEVEHHGVFIHKVVLSSPALVLMHGTGGYKAKIRKALGLNL